MGFMDMMKNELPNVSVTENGAIGYETSGHALLNINFAAGSMRNMKERDIEHMFAMALAENVPYAIAFSFFLRDCRGGMGERRSFRILLGYLGREMPQRCLEILPLIPFYGRWDDIFILTEDTRVSKEVREAAVKMIGDQLNADMTNYALGKDVSLLAKWMPSENSSGQHTRKLARRFHELLNIDPKSYRKMLSTLRKYIDVVERKMSYNEWSTIKYEHVPSKAMMLYRKAFTSHDNIRFDNFIEAVKKGDKTINASTLFPYELMNVYGHCSAPDETIEAQWKALPSYAMDGNCLVVCDGSGSMNASLGNTSTTAMIVARSLAVYYAERMKGEFHNKFITFGNKPRIVDLSGATTMYEKNNIAARYTDCSNTDIEATFNLILDTAINNHLKQNEIPERLLIISDMEFDAGTSGYMNGRVYYKPNKALFNSIAYKFSRAGYKMPHLVFWNVCSRTHTIPLKENELGVTLVSGFSPSVTKMVMSGKTDPYEALLDLLNSDRYKPVLKALK